MNSAPNYPIVDQAAPKSGLVYLRNQVKQYFDDNGVPAFVGAIGLKYRSFSGSSPRVIFIPGTFVGGLAPGPRNYGSLSRSNYNSASVVNPRELLQWDRDFTLSLWGLPTKGDSQNEEESIANVEDLLEQTVRALQQAAAGTILYGNVTLNAPPTEAGYGAELLVQCRQIGPIYDVTLDIATAVPAIVKEES